MNESLEAGSYHGREGRQRGKQMMCDEQQYQQNNETIVKGGVCARVHKPWRKGEKCSV